MTRTPRPRTRSVCSRRTSSSPCSYTHCSRSRAAASARRASALLVVAAYLDVLVLQALAVLFDPLTRYHSAHPRNLALVDSQLGARDRPRGAGGGARRRARACRDSCVLVAARACGDAGGAPAAGTRCCRRDDRAASLLASGSCSPRSRRAPVSSASGSALLAALALPVAFLGTLVQGRLSRAAVGELLLELRDPARPRRPRGRAAACARRSVAPARPARSRRRPLPRPLPAQPLDAFRARRRRGSRRRSCNQGEPIGMLVHDRSLRLRPELLDAVNAAAGFALANERALRVARSSPSSETAPCSTRSPTRCSASAATAPTSTSGRTSTRPSSCAAGGADRPQRSRPPAGRARDDRPRRASSARSTAAA